MLGRWWNGQDQRNTYRNPGINRYEWEREGRAPSIRGSSPQGHENMGNDRRPFPAGINRENVDGLINRQNARTPISGNQDIRPAEN